MHAHRVEVLDRADDHDVVEPVADHLELELAPALDRLLDEHLRDRALGETAGDDRVELCLGAREAAAVTAERERRPNCHRQLQIAGDGGARAPPACARSPSAARAGPTEAIACPNASRSSAVWMALAEAPISSISSSASTPACSSSMARLRAVWPPSVGSSASGRSRRRTPRHALEVERLEVRRVRPARVGHDRGRVRVDEHRAVALLAQDLERLHARVVELAGLSDHDRAGADDRDRAEVVAARHQLLSFARTAHASTNSASFSPRVVRAGRGLGVELHAPDRAVAQPQALDGAVVERSCA